MAEDDARVRPGDPLPIDGRFDDIARLAALVCDAPAALVGVLDGDMQVPRAGIGMHFTAKPLDELICRHPEVGEGVLVIPDLAADGRTEEHAAVTGALSLRFYAGVALADDAGARVGTLCVMDHAPRPDGLTREQAEALEALGRQVVTQLQLERERTRFQTVFDSASDYAIVVTDLEGRITDWSAGAAQLTGWKSEEVLGRKAALFFTPEDRTAGVPEQEMRDARSTGSGEDERWHLKKSGERFWGSGELMPLRGPTGALEGYVKMLRDQTEQRLTEERDEMALAGSGAVSLWDWIVETDLLHGDAHFARFYGLDEEQTAAGLTMDQYQEHVATEDLAALRRDIRAVFDTGADFHVEYRLEVPGEPMRWVECKGRVVYDVDGEPLRFSGTAIDITARKLLEEQRQLLMQELAHRMSNTFAVVQSIVSQTLRGVDEGMLEALRSRLGALSRAHDVLVQSSWSATSLRPLLGRVLRLDDDGERFELAGPDMKVGAQAALSLSLLLHELATNAVKYGALSVPEGCVRIDWELDGEEFCLTWRERGGPPARESARKGFGSRLIAMGIANARRVELTYGEEGFEAVFRCGREALAGD